MPLKVLLEPALERAIADLVVNYDGPYLLYDKSTIVERARKAKALEKQFNCRFLFAVKSCGEDWALELMCRAGLGFDVANTTELALVRSAQKATKLENSFISASGPAIGDLLGDADVDIAFLESKKQLDAVSDDQKTLGVRVAFSLNDDPDASLLTRFGVRPESDEFGKLMSHLQVDALHYHQAGKRTLEDVVEMTRRIMSQTSAYSTRYLNIGGGLHGIAIDELADLLKRLREFVPLETQILIEPGSFWFVGAGYALGQILEFAPMKQGVNRVTLDLSNDCHLRWSKPKPVAAKGLPSGHVLLGGPTCHEGDVIGPFAFDATQTAKFSFPHGFVLFAEVDGYSAAWNCGFNGIAPAKVVLFE